MGDGLTFSNKRAKILGLSCCKPNKGLVEGKI